MSSKKILLIISLTVLTTIVVFFVIGKKSLPLISPVFKQNLNKQSTSAPSTSSYNPPKEIKYDSSTDLIKELETVDPQVLDEDFQELNN